MIEKLNVRAVVFDAVGTLIYAAPPVAAVYARVGRQHGSLLTAAEVRSRFAPAFQEHYANKSATVVDQQRERQCWQRVVNAVFAGQQVDREAVLEDLWSYFARSSSWRMFADAADVWRELEKADLILGIASNFDDRLISVCEGIEQLSACRHLYNSAAIGFAKPDIRFFEHIQRRLGLPAEQICMIGDDPRNDVQAARDAGWQSLLVDRGLEQREKECTVNSLRQLLDGDPSS
ncbi:MAG: putative hydrolase of the HAD superfamily [Pirellulaceae bacterium]|jgi:putative hydrolase of the HAD superfamily